MSLATHESMAGSGRWDRLGIAASAACTVHCLIAPVLFLALPNFASVWAHPASHALVALLVLPLAGTVIRKGFRLHGSRWVVGLAISGMICIVVGSVLPYLGSSPSPEAGAAAPAACTSCCPQLVAGDGGETHLVLPPASIVTVAGSFLLIAAHFGNLVAMRCCSRA